MTELFQIAMTIFPIFQNHRNRVETSFMAAQCNQMCEKVSVVALVTKVWHRLPTDWVD